MILERLDAESCCQGSVNPQKNDWRHRARSLKQMITRVISHASATPSRIETSDSTEERLRTPAAAGCPQYAVQIKGCEGLLMISCVLSHLCL